MKVDVRFKVTEGKRWVEKPVSGIAQGRAKVSSDKR